MKKIFCVLAFAFASLNLFGQNNKEIKDKVDSSFTKYKTEIGLVTQMLAISGINESESLIGLQYKRWLSPRKAIRVLLAHQSYGFYKVPSIIGKLNGDTLKTFTAIGDLDMFVLGLGLEFQRHFYKRIYLTASLNLDGGYGKGALLSDTSYAVINDNQVQYYHSSRSDYDKSDHTRAFVRVSPSIGAKLVFKRFDFGTEMSFASLGILSENTYGKAYTISDFDLFGKTRYRLFASFRF